MITPSPLFISMNVYLKLYYHRKIGYGTKESNEIWDYIYTKICIYASL